MLNYVDLLIFLLVLYFIFQGLHVGFWELMVDFVSFFGSLLVSLKFYVLVANLINQYFAVTGSIAKALGFIFTAVIAESFLATVLGFLLHRMPKKIKKANIFRPLVVVPAVGEALVIISFLLMLVLVFPLSPKLKSGVAHSFFGSRLTTVTQKMEVTLRSIFGEAIEESISYLIIDPQSTERVGLQSEPGELTVDAEAESQMFSRVNNERVDHGVGKLDWYHDAVVVARRHATDMWERSYFSHYSPEGEDVGNRLELAGIDYFVAGENLALAPTVELAMTGLMASEGHKRNILDPNFDRVSIGVIDNGIYGKMFVQIFLR